MSETSVNQRKVAMIGCGFVCTDDIMYIDSDKHNVTLHLSDGSEIITVDKLGTLLAGGALFTSDVVLPAAGMLVWIVVAAIAFALVYKRLSRDN